MIANGWDWPRRSPPPASRVPRPTGVIQSADLTAPTVSGLCLGIGVTTVGVGALVCGVLVVGGASFTAGFLGSAGGELVADKIFESSR